MTATTVSAPAAAAVRGVLFDVDGTLYRQRPLRVRMAAELACALAGRPAAAGRTLRVLKAYRRGQEALRTVGRPYDADAQLEWAVERTGVTRREADAIVNEWMVERPLKHLMACRAPGLDRLLDRMARRGLALGVLSDYAPQRKLAALGVADRFPRVWCTADPDIRALKPDPRGFLVACAVWQMDPGEVLMVGDRHDVDAAGAAATGMRAVIVGRRPADAATDLRTTFVSSLEQVGSVIDDCC
jgi:FMN phosphatase YigB (HAD superfamily)